ncbi:MAG: DUF302 domain-containing protein [Acidiferrobacter sp.]
MATGLIQKTTTISCDEAIERLKAAATALSMGVVAHIDGQANAAKRGLVVDCDQILEVFRPDFALQVWAVDKAAGLDIPIRFHVYKESGRTVVAYRSPSDIFAPYGHGELARLGAELDRIFAAILDRALGM